MMRTERLAVGFFLFALLWSTLRACPAEHRPGDIQVGAPDGGLLFSLPLDGGGFGPWNGVVTFQPVSTQPPPYLCVALMDAGQACLDADTKDQAYRQLFDAVLASPHGFHRRDP